VFKVFRFSRYKLAMVRFIIVDYYIGVMGGEPVQYSADGYFRIVDVVCALTIYASGSGLVVVRMMPRKVPTTSVPSVESHALWLIGMYWMVSALFRSIWQFICRIHCSCSTLYDYISVCVHCLG